MGRVMQFGILGSLQVLRDGQPVRLGGARQRAVLARLLVEHPQAVSVDRLIDDVWAGAPPATATKTLQKYISELRKVLGSETVRTTTGGYVLDAPDDALDMHRFEQLVHAGQFDRALALWRGDVLADFDDLPFTAPARARLQELRLNAIEQGAAEDLEAGRHASVVARLGPVVDEHPLRERLCELLMRAMYANGRQVEALRAFEHHRQALAESGLEPSADLRALEVAIVRRDEHLLRRDEPPTRAAGNLQLSRASFVGRDDEQRVLRQCLRSNRLVTLTGPGGIGKTRLAVEVSADAADEYADGVWMVDLGAVISPDLVTHTAATALSLVDQREQGDGDTIVAALRTWSPVLLLLDNCEHLIEACAAFVDQVLCGCPNVTVVATSRRPLGVDGEFVMPVGSLLDEDAVLLFADRSRLAGAPVSTDPLGEELVADICRSLDGLPLAIELAASQVRLLSDDDIATRLDDRLQFRAPRFGVPDRQRTLRDMVGWSYELLEPATRRVFERLGVFATTLPLDAAQAVGGETDALRHLAALVDQSLLVREPEHAVPTRYRLLDTLRIYALERLDASGTRLDAERAHATFFLELVRVAGPNLYGPDEQRWTSRLVVEEPNLHLALRWATANDRPMALELAVALWPYWEVKWRERKAVEYLLPLLEPVDDSIGEELRAWGLAALADLASNPGEARRAPHWAEESVAIFRSIDEPHGLALALIALACAYSNRGALDQADAAAAEAIGVARALDDAALLGRALYQSAFAAARRGDFARAALISREELACWSKVGSVRGEATALRHLAVACRYTAALDEATALCHRALELWRIADDHAAIAHVRTTLADVARVRGDLDGASALYGEALLELQSIGDRRCTASTFKNLGIIAVGRGDHDRGAQLFSDALGLRHELGDDVGLVECLEGLAGAFSARGQYHDAAVLLAAARMRREEGGVSLSDEDRVAVETLTSDVGRRLDRDALAAATVSGRALSIGDAVDYARSRAWVPQA